MKKRFLILTGLFSIVLCLASCDEGPPPTFTASQREWIDTLYLQRVSILRPRLDSACEANFNIEVLRIADSLVKVRKAEEAELRKRALGQQDSLQ